MFEKVSREFATALARYAVHLAFESGFVPPALAANPYGST